MRSRPLNHLRTRAALTAYGTEYRLLLKKIKGYNESRPYHEDTGARYTSEERKKFQLENIENLLETAKFQRIEEYVAFRLNTNLQITMSVCRRRLC